MSSDHQDKLSATELAKADPGHPTEAGKVPPDYSRSVTWLLVIAGIFFGAAVDSLVERRMLPAPEQTVERICESSNPKLSDEILELEMAIRISAKRSAASNTSPADAADEIIGMLQRRVFLNDVRRDEVREHVKEFLRNKRSGAALEELLTALKAMVREMLFGTTSPGSGPSPSPSPAASPTHK